MEFEAVENPSVLAPSGAGIQAAQLVANKGAQVVLTGNMGPNAYHALTAAGVTVIVGVIGTVREALEKYQAGTLQPAQGPSRGAHFGLGGAPGWGMGRGRGMGRGMGWGGGWAATQGVEAPPPPPAQVAAPAAPPTADRTQALQELRAETEALRQQVEETLRRLEALEKRGSE